ncbi:MAG: hypothetical protein IAF38_03830, partial [Bacteroidia bacterium]|nr:hypothetical protein [Bacteroidia bacterium]
SPSIFADVMLNLMGTDDFSFSAATTVYAIGKITPPASVFEKPSLAFDKVVVNNIVIEVNTQVFYLKGTITYKKDDPVYGKGFFGGIALSIKDVLEEPISSNVWFGTVNNMKYWYVDATVPVAIPVGPVIEIRRLKGALYYHMRQNQSVVALANAIHDQATLSNPLTFVPDSTIGLGFKAGAYFIVLPNEKLANGDVQFEIEFNSPANGGGLNHVGLNGQVYFLANYQERSSSSGHKVTGYVNMLYDNMTKSFDAILAVNLQMPKISGSAQCVIHLDSVNWSICVGKPSQKANLSVLNLGNISAYFMIGNQLEPMPAIPNYITNVVNCSGLQQARNNQDLSEAKGWVTGASFSTSKNGSFGFDFFEVYYGFWAQAGFDMMLANYGPTAHCAGDQDKIGINGWYAQGQMYAYLSGNVGVRGNILHKDFDFTILNLQAAAILAGQAPKPTYTTGGVGCDYEIFGTFNGHIDFGFEIGSYCSVTQ